MTNNDTSFRRAALQGMTEDEMESLVRAVFAEGATTADIRWWWGMSQAERDSIVESDSAMRLAAFSHFYKDLHMDPKSAFRKLHETFIIYSDYPLEPAYFTEMQSQGFTPDDYVLPWELGNRIGIYVQKLATNGKEQFQAQMKGFTTANAFLRHKLKVHEI